MSKKINLNKLYIIAEAAQGYEGNVELAKMLVRGAAAAKADAIKFQIVYASDLCEPGYEHYELFTQLEMSSDQWKEIRNYAKDKDIAFIIDVFGEKSLETGIKIDADGYKLHSTTFFDEKLATSVFSENKLTFISVGGIEPNEIDSFIEKHQLANRNDVAILFGFQSEPTPIEANNLSRINTLSERTSLPVGFMDHSDGDSDYIYTLSAMAMGIGVNIYEKHISLDRVMELEDYISALTPDKFSLYVKMLNGLKSAFGTNEIELTDAEKIYRGKALKRVVASRNLDEGHVLTVNDLKLSRPAKPAGLYKPNEVIGKTLKHGIKEGEPIGDSILV